MIFNDINNAFVNNTLQLLAFSSIIIILSIFFVLSPLNNLLYIASVIKLLILLFIVYTSYLSILQIQHIRIIFSDNTELSSDVNVNIIGLYIYVFLLGVCFIYIMKSLFSR